jgi:uncharacterized protein YegP (UPF0339 family)
VTGEAYMFEERQILKPQEGMFRAHLNRVWMGMAVEKIDGDEVHVICFGPLRDKTEGESEMRIEVYSSKRPLRRRQWRWRAVHDNGNIMAISGESYNNSGDLYAALRTVRGLLPKAKADEL